MGVFDGILKDGDEGADQVIYAMTTSAAAAALVPFQVNLGVFATALGGGVVAIGHCYGVTMNESGAWKLIRQFIYAAGFSFLGVAVTAKLITSIYSLTGEPISGIFLDVIASGSIAYAVGKTAQAYFKGERVKEDLGRRFRTAYAQRRDQLEQAYG